MYATRAASSAAAFAAHREAFYSLFSFQPDTPVRADWSNGITQERLALEAVLTIRNWLMVSSIFSLFVWFGFTN